MALVGRLPAPQRDVHTTPMILKSGVCLCVWGRGAGEGNTTKFRKQTQTHKCLGVQDAIMCRMAADFGHCPGAHHGTMRFGSTAKVLLKCRLKCYRISECMVLHPQDQTSVQCKNSRQWLHELADMAGKPQLFQAHAHAYSIYP